MPRWLLPFLAGAVTVALVATSATAVVQYRRTAAAEARADALAAEVASLRDRIEQLEREAAEDDTAADGGSGLFRGLPDGEALGGLLDGLLGGMDDIPGAGCLTPDGAGLDGLLGGLVRGGSGTTATDPDELVAEVAAQVAQMRELDWQQQVAVDFLDDAQIRARLRQIVDEEYDPADAELDGRLLQALGAVPRGADLRALYLQLLEEQVAGFYHRETGELVVRVPSGGIRAADQITLAHELQHALADQALGLPDLSGDAYAEDGDAALGAIAVVEGDATLLMNQWALRHLGLGEQLGMLLDPSLAAAQAALQDLPPFMVAELMYPYTAGLDWVCDLWLDGGWAAVDKAYGALPATSAQILWDDHPGRVAEPTRLSGPSGWEQATTTTFGAAPLLWLLEAPGGDGDKALPDAPARAKVWGGGQATVWVRGPDTAVSIAMVDRGTGPELCTTVRDWYQAAFPTSTTSEGDGRTWVFEGEHQDAALTCPDDQVHLAVAPDAATATGMLSP